MHFFCGGEHSAALLVGCLESDAYTCAVTYGSITKDGGIKSTNTLRYYYSDIITKALSALLCALLHSLFSVQ